jgi:Protochlamydia outer membrane protein
LTPRLGYDDLRQELVLLDGSQTIPPTGPFDGLYSTYDTERRGPWAGVDLRAEVRRLSANARFERYRIGYVADGNWNLREDLEHPRSYQHTGSGHGEVFRCEIGYRVAVRWWLDLSAEHSRWRISDGVHRAFAADGTRPTSRLNEVVWDSSAILVGATYRFRI